MGLTCPPPSLLPVHLGLSISCMPDTVFGAGNTRWARQARPHSPGASHPSGGDGLYTSARAIKIWVLKVPGGDFPGGTVDKNPPANTGDPGQPKINNLFLKKKCLAENQDALGKEGDGWGRRTCGSQNFGPQRGPRSNSWNMQMCAFPGQKGLCCPSPVSFVDR